MPVMTVLTTPQELLDLELWDAACQEMGWSAYILNEGLMRGDDSVVLSWEQAKRIGLLPADYPLPGAT